MSSPSTASTLVVNAAAGTAALDGGPAFRWDPAGNLPVATGSVDAVELLEPGDRPTAAVCALVRECRRVLRPGGTVRLDPRSIPTALAELTEPGDTTGASGLDRVARYCGLMVHEPVEDDAPVILELPVSESLDWPLVSILIAGYRVTFLDEALQSARRQTWRHLEILVGDDCSTDAVHELTAGHAAVDPRVRYIGRAEQRGGRPNLLHLLAEARGDYVKFLNDDDVLHAQCVEKMVACLETYPNVTLVTSHRQPMDARGRHLQDLTTTARRVAADSIIDGASAAADVLRLGYNWIGEPSTTMFRRGAIDTEVPFGVVDEPVLSSGDIALWIKLLGRGDLVYLTETLSGFRQHDGQRQKQPEFAAIAETGRQQTIDGARLIGLDQPGARRFSARPIDLRPWWSARAMQLVGELDIDNADSVLAALDDELPAESAVALLRAQVALARGDAEGAVEVLDRAADRNVADVAVLKLLAVALLHLGALPLANRMLWLARDLCPHDEDTEATIAALADDLAETAS
jgi:hypothetical protein